MRYARESYHNLERTEGARGRADVSGRQDDSGGSHTSPVNAAQLETHLKRLYTNLCSMRKNQEDSLCTAAELRPH